MRRRLVATALVAVIVGGASALVIARSGGSGGPRALPVASGGTAAAASALQEAAIDGPAGFAGVVYEPAGELPELGGESRAWAVEAGDPGDGLAALAEALGVGGAVVASERGWQVSGPGGRLEVERLAGLPWWFTSEDEEPVAEDGDASAGSAGTAVAEPEPAEEPAARTEPAASDEPVETTIVVEPVPAPTRPADLPDRTEAVHIAHDVLTRAGVDTATAAIRVDDNVTSWTVTAEPEVGGLPTVGFGTSVTVGPGGAVVWAGGWLGTVESGDTYPLIGTAAALDRLRAQAGPGIPEIMIAPAEPASECPPEADCLAPGPQPEPQAIVVHVTGVRLGLSFMPAHDGGEAWLVPAYLFELDGGEGGDSAVVGIPDELLIEPASEPQPLPVEPDTPVSIAVEPRE